MDRGKLPSTGRGTKSKAPQHPQDIFALGSKSTVGVSSSEKRNIHKPSTSGVERKREPSSFGSQPPSKRSRIGSPAESVGGCSLEVDPVDLVPSVLHALDTHNSDKLLGLLTGSIRLLKSQRSKPDPILCMSMLYLTKIRPNMFAHDVVTQSLCTLLKREQGAAFKSKGNPLVFVLACNMLYAGHRDSSNWPDTFIKVYIEDALNERWWVECVWCKCLVENIVTAFRTKTPPPHLIPSDSALGTMSPSGSGSPLMGTAEEETDNTEIEYTVFPRYSSSYEAVEGLVLEAIKDQIQRRAAPDAIGKGFLKLLSATCGFPEIRMIAASRLEAWLHSGKLWRCGQELLAHVCCNAACSGPCAARDHEVLAQLARMRLKTKPLQQAYQACLREMVSDSPALLRSVVTHTIYNELSAVRSPNNMAVLCALVQAQPQLVPAATAATYQELLFRPEDYLRPLRALTRECVRAARADVQALLPLARGLVAPPTTEPPNEVRERAFSSLADLLACCCLVTASHSKHIAEYRQQLTLIQSAAVGWLLDVAMPVYRPTRQEYQTALNKIMFVEPAETYTKVDNWPPESERALTYRLCCEAPLPQNTLLRVIFCGLNKEIPVSPAEVFELVEQLVRRACALPPEDSPLTVDKLELADYIFQLCTFTPPDNITLPAGYTPPPLAITSLYWRGWMLLCMIAAHNPQGFAERAAATYPTLRALIETCITGKPSIEWNGSSSTEAERAEAEKAAILQLETHLATASNAKLPITEHSSRLLSQLTTLDPLGPARKPPQTIIDTLQQLSSTLRLGKLLCRQPALLLELVERHGTRRAMPWLHQLLRHDQLQLSVLPVQCLCEFLSAGGAGGSGKAGELCAHLRHTLATSGSGARAVLGYYLQRLAHPHASTRAPARRGLKLVLGQSSDETVEMDYNADVSPEEFLPILPTIRHWESVQTEAIARIRTACLVECVPSHVASYIIFLAQHALATTTDFMLDLSQLLMERMTIMGAILPAAEARDQPRGQDAATRDIQLRTLHALTTLFYSHMQKVRSGDWTDDGAELPGVRLTIQWGTGQSCVLHSNIAHATIKLLCYGPQQYDTNQEMYQWLQSIWLGPDVPQILDPISDEDALLPDWLRLHLVRSARPKLLEAGLRGLPAHKLALFIQTFGMPVVSMNALLAALDACPVSALSRLGVERSYMTQLLAVQRARGATHGRAFASALRLTAPHPVEDDHLFEEDPLPEEKEDPWEAISSALPLQPAQVSALLATAFAGADSFTGDLDTGLTQLNASITEEMKRPKSPRPYSEAVVSFLQAARDRSEVVNAMVLQAAYAAPLLRAMLPAANQIREIATSLLRQVKCETGAVVTVLRAYTKSKAQELTVPPSATKEELIAALESASPSTLEALGSRIIETQNSQLIVDVIGMLLENHQNGKYDVKVKREDGIESSGHTLSKKGLGCGLLLDWLAELQKDTLHGRQMRLMFESGGAAWRPLLVTLLVHRASWTTLHNCLTTLLQPNGKWAPSAVLDFAETLVESGRVWQGRENTARQHDTEDFLRLDHTQLETLIRYIVLEAEQAESTSGIEGMRRSMERRLVMLLRCVCSADACALLAAALAAAKYSPALLLLLYMKVPKILKLLQECEPRPPIRPILPSEPALRAAAGASTAASDRVSHTLLTAIAAAANTTNRDINKIWRMEALLHSVWSRVEGAGQRALPLAGALLRGAVTCNTRHHHHLLAILELLPDDKLFAPHICEEVHAILDCLVGYARAAGGAQHRLAGVLRRYLSARPLHALPLLHRHKQTIQSIPALSSLTAMEVTAPASAAPPPAALAALQRRQDTPDELANMIQDIESWGIRRGGSWGGAGGGAAGTLLRAVAPLCGATSPALRQAALSLLAKLLPATTHTAPGVQAILECLDSSQPEIAASCLEKLPDLIAGVQEHASIILARVFELGMQSTQPIEQCLAKCVSTINLQRGC